LRYIKKFNLPLFVFFLSALILGLGIRLATSQTSAPSVVVTVLNNKIGSSANFSVNISADGQGSNVSLQLSVFDDTKRVAVGTMASVGAPALTFNQSFSASAISSLVGGSFVGGHNYTFTAKDLNSSATGSDTLIADNTSPTTNFFFTNFGFQSYPSNEDFKLGALNSVNVVSNGNSDAVVLAGPTVVLSQPLGTALPNQLNFNQPQFPPSTGTGAVATSTYQIDSNLVANTSIMFGPAPAANEINAITSVINLVGIPSTFLPEGANGNRLMWGDPYPPISGLAAPNGVGADYISPASSGGCPVCDSGILPGFNIPICSEGGPEDPNFFSVNLSDANSSDSSIFQFMFPYPFDCAYGTTPSENTSSYIYTYIEYDGDQFTGNNYFQGNLSFNPDSMFNLTGAPSNATSMEMQSEASNYNCSGCLQNNGGVTNINNFDVLKNFTQPIKVDRLVLNVNAFMDPNSTASNGNCTNGSTSAGVSVQMVVVNTANQAITLPGVQYTATQTDVSNKFQPSTMQSGSTQPNYYSGTMLPEAENIISVEISGSASQGAPCFSGASGGFSGESAFNGPIVNFAQVGAYAPVTNTNPVTIETNGSPTAYSNEFLFNGSGNSSGITESVFDFESRSNFTVSNSTSAEVVESFQGLLAPVTIANIDLQGFSGYGDIALVFSFPSASNPVTCDISNHYSSGSFKNFTPKELSTLQSLLIPYLNSDGSLRVTSVSVLLTATSSSTFTFGDCYLYGDPTPVLAGGNGAPATFFSPVFNIGTPLTGPYSFTWNGIQNPPSTTFSVYTRSGNISLLSSPPYPATGWQPCASGDPVAGLGIGSDNSFQYMVVMSHSDPNQTPVFQSAVLQAGLYNLNGSWTSESLPLANPNLGVSSPYPQAVVSWRSKNPTGTSVGVSIVTSASGFLWSTPTAVGNATPIAIPSTANYVKFIGGLQTTTASQNVSPEFTNLDFGFLPPCPLTTIASGTNIFFTPLDDNSGVSITSQYLGLTPPTTSLFTTYTTPFTAAGNGFTGTGNYYLSGYSTDYAGNVGTGFTQTVSADNFSISLNGVTNGGFTNQPVTPTINIDSPPLTLGTVLLYQVKNGVPVGTGSPFTSGQVISNNGSYVIVAQATGAGSCAPFTTSASFTIFNGAPPQPTGLTLSGSGSCYSLNWNSIPYPNNPIDPLFEGEYVVVLNGSVTLTPYPPGTTPPGSTTYQDCSDAQDGANPVYDVYSVDSAGNFSTPAEISTIPSSLLITDMGNNRLLEVTENLLFPSIIWAALGNQGNSVLYPPVSASQNNTVDHINFGEILSSDQFGGEQVNTTYFANYNDSPGIQISAPDSRVNLLLPTAGLGFVINQMQKSYDGNYLICATSPSTTPPTGFVSKVTFDASNNLQYLWTIPNLINPTTVREVGKFNVLINDQGYQSLPSTVMNVPVPSTGTAITIPATAAIWDLTSDNNGNSPTAFTHSTAAIWGKFSGNYYVADPGTGSGNGRVVVLDPNQNYLTSVTGLTQPQAVEEESNGNLAIAASNGIMTYAPNVTGGFVGPFTFGGVQPVDVREVRPPYQVQVGTFKGSLPAYLEHPFPLIVVLSDLNGRPVANIPVSFATSLDAEFVPAGTILQSTTINPNTGIPEGTIPFSGGPSSTSGFTNLNGEVGVIYFPTKFGNNTITITSPNCATTIYTVDAKNVGPALPLPKVTYQSHDLFSSLVDSALDIVSFAADAYLDAMTGGSITFNIQLSLEKGIGVDVNLAGVNIDWNSQTGLSGGIGLQEGPLNAEWSTTNPGDIGLSFNTGGGNIDLNPDGSLSYSNNLGGFDNVTVDSHGLSNMIDPTSLEQLAAGQLEQGINNLFNPAPNFNYLNNQNIQNANSQCGCGGTTSSGTPSVPIVTEYGNDPTGPTSSHPIETSNGQELYASEDINIPGPAPHLSMVVSRTYNNVSNFLGSFGLNWLFEYDTYLSATPGAWEIYFGDGHQELFTRNADGITCTPSNYNRSSKLVFNSGAQQWTYTDKLGNQYLFNNLGRVVTETDRWGNQIICTYNTGTNLLASVQDSTGRQLTFTYTDLNAGGSTHVYRITGITDPIGRVYQYRYSPVVLPPTGAALPPMPLSGGVFQGVLLSDGTLAPQPYTGGDLIGVLLPDGRKITYTYSPEDLLASYDDPHQIAVEKTYSLQYDNQNRIIEETNALGYSTDFNYTISGLHDGTTLTTQVTNARGYTTTDTFDAEDDWTQRVDARGGVRSFTYDPYGNRLTETNARDYITAFTYDNNNNKTSQTDPMGNSIVMTYDPVFSQLTSITNALHKTWNFSYDGQGNLTGMVDPLTHSWSYTYFPYGRLKTATNPDINTTTFARDSNGYLVSGTDPIGNVELYQYDNVGRLVKQTDPMGNPTSYTYDPGDYLTLITYADGSTKQFNFNNRGDLASQTDENTHTTQYTYDAEDQLLTTVDPCGGTVINSYDPVGNLATTTDKAGNLWTMSYNENNWVISVSNQDGGTQNFVYDAVGNKTAWTDSEFHTTQAEYDPDNQLIQLTDPRGKTMVFSRDALERVYATTDKNTNTTQYLFDDAGRTKEVIDARGGPVSFNYDAMGNLTSAFDQLNHGTSITYDTDNRATTITRPMGDSKVYTYTPAGFWQTAQLTGCSCGTRTYAYNSRNWVKTITDELGSVYHFADDPVGNETQFTDADGNVTNYSYDFCNRLIKTVGPVGDMTQYSRDLNGRVTKKTDALGGLWLSQYNQIGSVVSQTDADGFPSSATYGSMGEKLSSTDANTHTTTYVYDSVYDLISKTDPLNNVTLYQSDAMGYPTKVTDANGHSTTYQRDALSRIYQVDEANGANRELAWDAASRLMSTTDEDTDMTQYSYDNNDRMISQTDPLTNSQSWLWNSQDKVVSYTDQDTNMTTYFYNALGWPVSMINAKSGATTYGYDAIGNLTSITDPNIHTTGYQYDGARKLISAKDALGNVTQYQNDLLHRLIKSTDALNKMTQFKYDADSRLLQKTDPLGGRTINCYDHVGNLTILTDPNGNTTRYSYDADNRKTLMTNALLGPTSYSYDFVGNQVGMVNANGNSTLYGFDPLNRLIKTTDALGGSTTSQLDSAGYLVGEADANGNGTSYLRDADHRVTTKTDARGKTTGYLYDPFGNVLRKTDADTNATQYSYDSLNRPVTTIDANTHKVITVYDPVGNPVTIFDQNLHPRSFTYDADNHTLSETDATGHAISYTYDFVENRVTKTDALGTRNYKYDGDRRLAEQDLPDGKIVKFTRDSDGNILQASDWNGTYKYNFDKLNRVTQETQPGGKSISHTYDPMGNETGRVDYLGNKYSYTFDAINRPTQVIDPLNGVTGMVYDHMQHVLQIHYPNKTSVNNSYDPTYDVLSVINKKDTGEVISQFTYTYDGVGNKMTVTDNIGKTTYGYDNIYQLTSAAYPDRPAVSYGYDPAGNRSSMTVGTTNTSYGYDAANKLLTAGTVSYQYDGNGNPVEKTDSSGNLTTLYIYDTENRLVSATLPTGNQYLFGYDYTGWKISDTQKGPGGNPDTQEFLWSKGSVVNEDGNEGQTANNVLGLMNLSRVFTPKSNYVPRASYYAFDGSDSVANITDAGGNISDSYRYDDFGSVLSGGKSKDNHNEFVGKLGVENQAYIGLNYMRHRWYDPIAGRFMTQDPIGIRGGINLYVYVFNSPLNSVDIYGLTTYCPVQDLISKAQYYYDQYSLTGDKADLDAADTYNTEAQQIQTYMQNESTAIQGSIASTSVVLGPAGMLEASEDYALAQAAYKAAVATGDSDAATAALTNMAKAGWNYVASAYGTGEGAYSMTGNDPPAWLSNTMSALTSVLDMVNPNNSLGYDWSNLIQKIVGPTTGK